MAIITGDFEDICKYCATVNSPPYHKYRETDFAIITISGKIKIQILFDEEVKSAIVRPLSANIEYTYSENKVEVVIDEPINFTVEINESVENCVMVFADYKKTYNLDGYENVIVFDKGEQDIDTLKIDKDNTAVILSDGAYVHGRIHAENMKNIGIFGKGVLTLENYGRHISARNHLIFMHGCENVRISDVTITDSSDWSCRIKGCDRVEIDNIKVIGCRGNSDGIDICGSRNVYVHNCFTRVWDDSLVVKARNTGDVYNILFEKCTLWCDMARPIEVGVELLADSVKDVTFRNIDIIHSMCGYPVLGIHHGDRATVSDIIFEDIRIEDAPGAQLFDIRIADSIWNKDDKKGPIRNIIFKDISYIGTDECKYLLSNSRLEGYSKEACIDGITIENITVCGKSAFYDLDCGLDIYDYVQNVKLVPDKGQEKSGIIKTDIEYDKVERDTKISVKFTNRDDKKHKICASLVVLPKTEHYQCEFPIELEVMPGEEKVFTTSCYIPAGKFTLGIESKDASLLQCYKYLDNTLLLDEEFSEEYFFADSVESDGVSFMLRGDLLIIKSDLLKKHILKLYTALPTEAKDGEVLFSIRDTDMGYAPAIILKDGKEIMAPQLRNYEEITYVFKNEPEIKNFKMTRLYFAKNGITSVNLDKIGVGSDAEEFLMELEIPDDSNIRYSCCMFHSQKPEASAHMFVRVKRK